MAKKTSETPKFSRMEKDAAASQLAYACSTLKILADASEALKLVRAIEGNVGELERARDGLKQEVLVLKNRLGDVRHNAEKWGEEEKKLSNKFDHDKREMEIALQKNVFQVQAEVNKSIENLHAELETEKEKYNKEVLKMLAEKDSLEGQLKSLKSSIRRVANQVDTFRLEEAQRAN